MLPFAGRKISRADYVLLPEDHRIWNVLGGEARVTPSPTPRHQRVVARLHERLGPFVRERSIGECFLSPFDVYLSDSDIVQPDLFVVALAELHRIGGRGLEGAPTLAVEVLSPSTRRQDEVEKLALYERCGVPELWLVDPDRETVTVHRRSREAGGFDDVETVAASSCGALSSPLLGDLSIPVADLFRWR